MPAKIERPDLLLHDLLYAAKLARDRLRSTMGELGLHRGQGLVLMIVHHNEGIVQRDLAEAMHVSPATLSGILQRMEENGVVERHSDPDDDRVSRVSLTAAGRAMGDQARANARLVNAEIESGLRPEETMLLRRFLHDVQAQLQEHPPAPHRDGEPC